MPRYRIGTYNVRKGRNPRVVAREIKRMMPRRRILPRRRLAALNLQEAATQLDYLRDGGLPPYLRVIGYPSRDVSARDSAIVVDTRHVDKVGGRRLHRLHKRGWERAPHNRGMGLHNPRSAVSARVGALRVMSIHMPPTPYVESLPLRGEAFAEALDTVERVLARWTEAGDRWVAFGDWNTHVNSRDVWRMSSRLKATRHGSGIDWLLAGPGVTVRRVWRPRVRGLRSDHRPVYAVVDA